MPRKKLVLEELAPVDDALAAKLAGALKSNEESGQPLVYESELGSNRLRVAVIWDEWDRVPLDERTSIILRAYEEAEGAPYRARIALANGLTVPEATAAGMLQYQVA